MLPVVSFGCENWWLALREERRLRVLRRIIGPKGNKVTGECKKLHNELNDLYSSPNVVQVIKARRMKWVWHIAHMGERRGIYRVLVGRPEGKRPLAIPRHR
jgi:hypothetical protein